MGLGMWMDYNLWHKYQLPVYTATMQRYLAPSWAVVSHPTYGQLKLLGMHTSL